MRIRLQSVVAIAATLCWLVPSQAQEPPLGAELDALLNHARTQNLDYAAMRFEADAASMRIASAGSLPDPKFQMEFRDITRMGDRDVTLDPSRVGSTRYLLMQDFPWFGKRSLRENVASAEARLAQGFARGSWADLSALIRQTHVQRYFVARNERLAREILDLMSRLEKIAQVRYASGLVPQQDVIRAQLEQTAMRNELIALESERRALASKLNALLNRATTAPLADPTNLPTHPDPARLGMEHLIARLRANNAQVFVEASRIRAAEYNRDLTYKNRYPDITLGVSPIQAGNAVREWELMLQVSIPLQQGARRSQEREAVAMLEAAKARHEAAAHRLVGELAENLTAYEAATHTEQLVRTSLLPQSELSFQSALAGYENGKVDFSTLLEAQRQIKQALISQLKAQSDQHARLTQIERLIGESL